MYLTATQATAQALHLSVLSTVSLVVFWLGFSLWVLVAAGFAHSIVPGSLGRIASKVTSRQSRGR